MLFWFFAAEHRARLGFEDLLFLLPFLRDLPVIEPERFCNLESLDLPCEHGCGGFCDFGGIPRGEDLHAPLFRLQGELVHFRQTDGDQHGVHIEGPVSSRDDFPLLVQGRDGHLLYPVCSHGRDHGVTREDGHPQPHELIGVDFVSSHLGHSFYESRHFNAGLNRMISRDETDVPAPDDEDSFR